LLLLAISAAAFLQRRRRPYVLMGWLWFGGMLVPVWNTFAVGCRFMADRYTYLPLVGLFIAIVWLASDLVARRVVLRGAALTVAVVLIGILAGLTVRQQRVWRDSVSLWRHVRDAFPQNPLAWLNLGIAIWESGGDKNQALAHFREALRLKPQWVDGHFITGKALAALGRFSDAAAEQRTVLAMVPDGYMARYYLAVALHGSGDYQGAARECLLVLRERPNMARAHVQLAASLEALGNSAEAQKHRAIAERLRRSGTATDERG